jgi:hypothetical protein
MEAYAKRLIRNVAIAIDFCNKYNCFKEYLMAGETETFLFSVSEISSGKRERL